MKRFKPIYFIPVVIAIIFFLGWIILFRQKIIVLIINDKVQGITSRALTVKGALNDAGITLRPEDKIEPPLSKWIKNKQIIYITQSSHAVLTFKDQIINFYTSYRSPSDILMSIGIDAPANSIAYVNGYPYSLKDEIPYFSQLQIEITEPVFVEVSIDNSQQIYSSADKSASELFWNNDVSIHEADIFTPPIHDLLNSLTNFSFFSSIPLNINTGYLEFTIPVTPGNAGQALAQAGTSLQFLDKIKDEETAPLGIDDTIKVVSVLEKIALDQQLINFETQTQPIPDLEIDNQKLIQSGEYGLEAKRIRIRYEDGQEVSRKEEDKWIAREPVPRIEGYGTKIVVRSTQTDHGPIEYWRAMTFYATSYSPSRSGVSPDKSWYGHVACGGLLKNGYVGVDLDYIPCGTQLYIPGYGFATAMDTGNISGAWIDLGYEDKDYVAWHQTVTVYFLTPVPPPESIAYVIPPGTAP